MAGERTFVVKILGNSDGAITAFKNLAKEGMDSIDKIKSVGSKLGDAFDVVKKGALVALGGLTAVAGAAAGAVYMAAEDEKSQKLLQAQLERSAGATMAQVQATEAFITAAMLATGIADDDLRPAFGNLVRATGDLTQSQRLFNLALDISASTSRDLESVTLGLGRAATGQIGALTRLGIPLDEGAKKSKDFGAILLQLEGQFGGASAVAADTFSGRVKILKTSLGEVTETIGYLLMPAAMKLVEFFQTRLVPALQFAVEGFKEQGISGALKYFGAAMGETTFKVLNSLEGMILGFTNLELAIVHFFGPVAAGIDLLRGFASAITGGDGVVSIEQMLIDRTEGVKTSFDRMRNSVLNAGIAMNLQGNKISPTVDQFDKIGTKVLPKAKEATDGMTSSLDKLTGGTSKAGNAVATFKEKMLKYTDALKGSASAQKALTSAQKGTTDAQRNLDKANLDVASAQQKFNQAVAGYGADSKEAKDAQRDLDKAQRGVERAGYRVEESLFAVADAEKKLADIRKDPESSPQDIREAELRLAEAKLAVRDATDDQYDATNGLAKAQFELNQIVGGAIVGSILYDELLKDVNEAKINQADASERLKDATDRETEAFEALAEAIKKVADAAKTMPNANLAIPTLPTVPNPASSTAMSTSGGSGTSIVINTGIGTNGIQAGREIVEVLQQYTKLDRNAISQIVAQR